MSSLAVSPLVPPARHAPGRIVRAGDFEAILGSAPRARSAHFALHQLARLPPAARRRSGSADDLSTPGAAAPPVPVDDFAPEPARLGLVVPKRHARRAVTRTLVKRQIRTAMARHGAAATGWWVVRLRQPFSVARFPSAASTALKQAVAGELDTLFAAALRKLDRVPTTLPPSPVSA